MNLLIYSILICMMVQVSKADDELCEIRDEVCTFQNGKENDLYICVTEDDNCKSKKNVIK